MSVFGGVICCISAFYEYGQNAAKRKGAPLVCFGLLPGVGYYTHDGANTDTQRRACLCSVVHVVYIRGGLFLLLVWYSLNAAAVGVHIVHVVHVVHIKAGGVEALASCCIKGAFCLKKPLFLL